MRLPIHGAIASWSPTGFGIVTGHDYLEKGLMLAMFHDDIPQLGAAITRAKRYLLDNAPPGKYTDLVDTFGLLGDPALQVKTNSVCSLIPTGLGMASFSAQAAGNTVLLRWDTASEANMLGFNVLRSTNLPGRGAGNDFSAVNTEMIFAARSGSGDGGSYTYRDTGTAAGETYTYVMEVIQLDGNRERYGLAQVKTGKHFQYFPWLINDQH